MYTLLHSFFHLLKGWWMLLCRFSICHLLISQVREAVMATLAAVQLEDLPVVVKFILHSVSASDAYEVRSLNHAHSILHFTNSITLSLLYFYFEIKKYGMCLPLCRWWIIFVRSWSWSSVFSLQCCRPLRAEWRTKQQQCKTTESTPHLWFGISTYFRNLFWSRPVGFWWCDLISLILGAGLHQQLAAARTVLHWYWMASSQQWDSRKQFLRLGSRLEISLNFSFSHFFSCPF